MGINTFLTYGMLWTPLEFSTSYQELCSGMFQLTHGDTSVALCSELEEQKYAIIIM